MISKKKYVIANSCQHNKMTSCQTLLLLFCAITSLHFCSAVPLSDGLDEIPSQMGSMPGFAIFLISAAAILLLGYVVIGCVCCPNRSIKALTYQNGFPVSRLNENSSLQFENPSEFAIFPPHSAVIDLQPVGLSYPTFEDKVTFEPLPDILPRKLSGQSAACSSRPAHFRALLKNKVSLHDWFDDPNSNFPRDQLQYIQELGCGWFGRVIEGEASHISNTEEKTPVLVKILREEASPSEHLHFLHEVRPYRDLMHPNVVRLLGRCLESDPFLLIMEHSISDLKTFLIQRENKDSFVKNGAPLQMACNVAAGLKCLHENGFTHMDLAAHSCFVCKDLTVKVGDYGISYDQCREDYYCLGGIALPIRWCSPETLMCTDATIETKEITKEANVWTFGIILWEIFELGKLPYEELTNEEVLQKVLIERCTQLSTPSLEFPFREELSLIMKECWKPAHLRPTMEKIEKFLIRLYNDRHNLKTLETSFEERWNSLQPKPVETKLLGTDLVPLKFENDFSERSDSHNYSSDGERFSSFEMSYDLYSKSIGSHLSPSLRVLNGSIDELTENDVCLNSVSLGCERSGADAASVTSDKDLPQLEEDQGSQVGEIITPEQISDAIKDLDLVLASQPSDSSRQSTLQKYQLSGKKNSGNPFIAERRGHTVVEVGDPKGLTSQPVVDVLPNLNLQHIVPEQNSSVLKNFVNNNYSELQHTSVDLNSNAMNQADEPEMMSVENSPDSVSANKVLDFFTDRNELVSKSIGKVNNLLSEKGTSTLVDNNEVEMQSNKDGLASVPDIIVHESPSVYESSHDVNENIVEEVNAENSPNSKTNRPFRFIFKDESIPKINDETDHLKSSEGTSGSQNTPNATDSSLERFPEDLKAKPRSQQLTSTPLKSDQDINLNYSSGFIADDEDSGNVFYDNSLSDKSLENIENSSPLAEEKYMSAHHEIPGNTLGVNQLNVEGSGAISSTGSFYYEAREPTKSDATFRIAPNDVSVRESVVSVNLDDFASAQSNFDEKSGDEFSKTQVLSNVSLVSEDDISVSNQNGQTVTVNAPVPSFNLEMSECYSSAVESESLVKDFILTKSQETKNVNPSECSVEKNSAQKLEQVNLEDVMSLDFGEPVTPEVSFNVSSCSYGNECRSISTDSPGISSENKDLESDFEHPMKKKQGLNVDYNIAATPEYLQKDVDGSKHADFLDAGTTQNYPTLDSEASGSEYLESFSPDATSDSFGHRDEKRMESAGNMRHAKSNSNSRFFNTSAVNKTDLFYDEDDLEDDSESDTNAYKSKSELCLHPYDEVIVEDLETGEQTIITESFSACDDYDNSGDSDEILKINIETDEAIIVDSSEALIGFVPSRSIELLQECEIIPTLNPSFIVEDDKESSVEDEKDSNHFDASNSASSSPVAMQSTNSPYESPESTYPLHQPYRNFSLQNEVIEEEITDEIATPSSIRSTASFSSNDMYIGEEKMSQSSESYHQDFCETSVLPTVDHFYGESDDGSRSDVSNSDCSPIHGENGVVNNIHYVNDIENNRLPKELNDVMYSKQPTQSVCWHSDETLDIERDSPVILEGREILAGGMLETRGMSVKDITATLNQLDVEDRLNRKTLDHLSISQSPSPYSSVESSPCRDAYTPDFESDSDGGGTSCSSTSGSFECIHNKFKDIADISKAADESDPSDHSREQSPRKIFSKTWNCHATPSKSVLVTPEKKFHSLRKSVSFHEEDPQVVFEYPPASDSSEDGGAHEEIKSWGIDYQNFADWELQAGENEEIAEIEEVLEIEELDSEPYVRRPTYGIGASLGPMNRPMLYSLTSGFSDDDMDLSEPSTFPSESIAPSNSPEEGKHLSLSGDQISELIKSQLNNLALEESRLKWMQDVLDQQSQEYSCSKSPLTALDQSSSSVHVSEEITADINPVSEQDIVIEELLLENIENATVRHEDSDLQSRSEEKLPEENFAVEQLDEKFMLFGANQEIDFTPSKEFDGKESKLSHIDFKDVDLLENDNGCTEIKTDLNSFEFSIHPDLKGNVKDAGVENSDLFLNNRKYVISNSELEFVKNDFNSFYTNESLVKNHDSVIPKNENDKNSTFIHASSNDNEQNLFHEALLKGNAIPNDHNFSSLPVLDKSDSSYPKQSEEKELAYIIDSSNICSSNHCNDSISPQNSPMNEKVNEDSTLLVEILPLTLDEGNKRPNSIKNKLTFNEIINSNSFQGDISAKLSPDEKSESNNVIVDSPETSVNPNISSDVELVANDLLVSLGDHPCTDEQGFDNRADVTDECGNSFENFDCGSQIPEYMQTKSLAIEDLNKVGTSHVEIPQFLEKTEDSIDNATKSIKAENHSISSSHLSNIQTVQDDCILNAMNSDNRENLWEFENTTTHEVDDFLNENSITTENHSTLHSNLNNENAQNISGLNFIDTEKTNDPLETESTINLKVDSFVPINSTENVKDGITDQRKIIETSLEKFPLEVENSSQMFANTTVDNQKRKSDIAYDSGDKSNGVSDEIIIQTFETVPVKDSVKDNNKDNFSSKMFEEKVTKDAEAESVKYSMSDSKDHFASKVYEERIHDPMTNQAENLRNLHCSSIPQVECKYAEGDPRKILNSEILGKVGCSNGTESLDDINTEEDSSHRSQANFFALGCQLEKESALNCKDSSQTLEASGKKAESKNKLLEPKDLVPQIVVTPASESEVEDELEEFLRDQLEFFHGPSVTEGEDFSVTSQFSIRPFEDVFGSQGAQQNSGDYIEAFNFEFDSGDFFDDFLDDYPAEVSNPHGLSLDNGNPKWWESPNAPPMVERSSEDDDLNSKPESSPLYYSTKDSTHL